MAESLPLAGLLERASQVFSLAGKLGKAFHDEHQEPIDAAGWELHAPDFDKFCTALLDLRDAMQNPPDGFAPVAKPLLDAARIAKQIRDAMQRPDGRTYAAYREFFPNLNSVGEDGWRAVKEVTKTRRLDDPFAFVDEPKRCVLKADAGGFSARLQPVSLISQSNRIAPNYLADDYAGPTSGDERRDLLHFLGMPPDEQAKYSDAGLDSEWQHRLRLRREIARTGKPNVISAHGLASSVALSAGDPDAVPGRVISAHQAELDKQKAEVGRKDAALDELVKRLEPAEPKPGTTSAPTRRGRPKADYETVQREAQIAADWKQAKEAGTYKGDFARDRGTTVAELDALLDRVAKRNRPSE